MKIIKTLTFLCLAGNCMAETLTEEKKAALLEQAKAALTNSEAAIKKKNRGTYKVLASAFQSKQECISLYLDAVKEINFTSKGKSTSAFIDWKRNNKEKYSNKANAQWLQYQVQWLYFAVEARNMEDNGVKEKFVKEIANYLDGFYSNLEKFHGDAKDSGMNLNKEFQGNIMEGEISKYLGINHSTGSSWPSNPTNIDAVYSEFIFPFVHDLNDLALLKTAWSRRIKQEATLIEALNSIEKKGLRGDEKGIVVRQFESITKPNLVWDMLQDFYQKGAEEGSVEAMLKHVKNYPAHPNSPKWANVIISLLQPEEEEEF